MPNLNIYGDVDCCFGKGVSLRLTLRLCARSALEEQIAEKNARKACSGAVFSMHDVYFARVSRLESARMLSGGSAKRTARQRSMTTLQKAVQEAEALRCEHLMADNKQT